MGSARTLAHKHLDSPALERHRQQHLDPASMHTAAMGWGGAIFWNRAPLPVATLPTITDERRQRYRDASQPYFAGHTFVDGSGHKCHWLPAGWVGVPPKPRMARLLLVFTAVSPGASTAPRAELHTVHAVLPFLLATMWSDHKKIM